MFCDWRENQTTCGLFSLSPLLEKMPSSSGSADSDDGDMGLGQTRADSSESTEDKVVEKSPKGRFHRVCRETFPCKITRS
jgi:hypothetical protein